jgi:16S rRNA (guanine527-N7)-methyltransferase
VRREVSNWKSLISANGVPIDEDQIDRLNLYSNLLIEWNSKVNLVSRKDERNIWPNHILHSVSLLFTLAIPDGVIAADIGSGGGLPGVPLAIMLPKVQIIMIESIRKKCVALRDIVLRLGIPNARVVEGRVEEISALKDHRSRFDVVFARAVAPLKDLITWSVPLVRKESGFNVATRAVPGSTREQLRTPLLVAMKGGNLEEEIAQAKQMPDCRGFCSFDLHFSGIEQTTLVEKKIILISL